MLDSANDSIRRLKANLVKAEAVASTARSEASAAARAAEDRDVQMAEREAEIADLQCAPQTLIRRFTQIPTCGLSRRRETSSMPWVVDLSMCQCRQIALVYRSGRGPDLPWWARDCQPMLHPSVSSTALMVMHIAGTHGAGRSCRSCVRPRTAAREH